MNRKALATAVAAVFAAPAALAQSALTISGNVTIIYDYAKAGGNTGGDVPGGTNNSLKGHDRVRDGTLSNIRFTVTEDLGGGASAFVQVESAVIQNSDTRSNAAGAGAVTGGWGNRNSGVGLMSKAAGRFVVGVWDLHHHELYPIEPGREITHAAAGVLGLMQNFGSGFSVSPFIGTRYSNIIRWDSPVWSGFSVSAGYARPTDGAPVNSAGDVRDGKNNRAWSVTPRFESGGLQVRYSYLQDKDIATNATPSLRDVYSGRFRRLYASPTTSYSPSTAPSVSRGAPYACPPPRTWARMSVRSRSALFSTLLSRISCDRRPSWRVGRSSPASTAAIATSLTSFARSPSPLMIFLLRSSYFFADFTWAWNSSVRCSRRCFPMARRLR